MANPFAQATPVAVAPAATKTSYPWDFEAKSNRASFTVPDMANQSFVVENVFDSKAGNKCIILQINGGRYLFLAGDLNASKGFLDVVDPNEGSQGNLSFKDGARVTCVDQQISWSIVS